MHLRKQMVVRVFEGELSLSGAAREYGVSRNTVKLWVRRAEEETLSALAERSRRPRQMARSTPDEVQRQILELKAKRPVWGAKKIVSKLWPQGAPLSVRTADRILARHGLVMARGCEDRADCRFERGRPNELLQLDFKGMRKPYPGYTPLSVLDDATRFCLAFKAVPNHQATTVFQELWELFGQYGLPQAILTDNEPCFAEIRRNGPSWLEARLWLLGIDVLHGRPYHPQTQGKVERFHLTAHRELGEQLRSDPQDVEAIYARFAHDYNYERPHEAIGMKCPGAIYTPSDRKRPAVMPQHEPTPGCATRKVTSEGGFDFKCTKYRAGRGLQGQLVELQEEEHGYGVYFTRRRFANLEDIKW